jgi:hypothetical protein
LRRDAVGVEAVDLQVVQDRAVVDEREADLLARLENDVWRLEAPFVRRDRQRAVRGGDGRARGRAATASTRSSDEQ